MGKRGPTPRERRKALDAMEGPAGVTAEEKLKTPFGRPTKYTPELGEKICLRMAAGDLLVEIVEEEEFPASMSSVYRWLEDHPDFRQAYARAREMQGHAAAERAVVAGRKATAENAAAARVKFDADRWFAAKLLPKSYGDQSATTINNTVIVDDEKRLLARQALILELAALAKPEPLTIESDGTSTTAPSAPKEWGR